MRVKDKELSNNCMAVSKSAREFVEWSEAFPDVSGQDIKAIKKDFCRYSTQMKRLATAATRPMGVAVFGPSQAGKSYLISALAKNGESPLKAKFESESIDFLRQINPEGGKESTGIVTRFTIRDVQSTHSGKPVRTRLLDQVDIIKILGNTFLADVDPGSIPSLESDDIASALERAKVNVKESRIDDLDEESVYDLRDYFMRYFRGVARVQALKDDFWNQLSQILPFLEVEPRAELLSLLWAGNQNFTDLYIDLYNSIKSLGFSEEAYAELGSLENPGALIPRDNSVIDVAALQGLGAGKGKTISVKGGGGLEAELPRCNYAALISELFIEMVDRPYEYFDHTDLLDFPGYRSREQIRDLGYFFTQEGGIESLFLRGKVAYLFQRYREERELTSMLLCVADSNQEVKSLPEVVDEWIQDTHGETPIDRNGKPVSLFLVLTKFDKEFDKKGGAGETIDDFSNKWKTRMHSSLWDFFGKQHSWPKEWDSARAFNNTFWIRNPGYEAPHLFEYDDSGKEVGLLSSQREAARIQNLKQAFIETAEVSDHFADPELAWKSALTPGDGGVTYLAEQLGHVCDPDLKYNQISQQFLSIKRDMLKKMSDKFVSSDMSNLIQKRIDAGKSVAAALIRCAEAERFGTLLSKFYVSEKDLNDIYYKVDNTHADEVIVVDNEQTSNSDLYSLLDIDSHKPENNESDKTIKSFAELYADEVVSNWILGLHTFAEDSSSRRYFSISDEVVIDFIKELKSGFNRLNIRSRVIDIVNESTRLRMSVHKTVTMPARLTAQVINDYVNFLGYQEIDESLRPYIAGVPVFKERDFDCGTPTLEETSKPYQIQYSAEWLKSYMHLVEKNANSEAGSVVNHEANEKLDTLIQSVA